jgi:hypothetical protein
METIYEIVALEDRYNNYNAFASTKEKAEKYLSELGFVKITDTLTESEEYQTWIKEFKGNFFFAPNTEIMTVKPYNKFIA